MPKEYNREQLEFKIYKCDNKNKTWEFYKKYHYLNDKQPSAGHGYECVLGDKRVGYINIRYFPHPKTKNMMVISRIVVVPEFQGLGIGLKFMNCIADIYADKGFRVTITTSLKPFIKTLKKNILWRCTRFGRTAPSGKNSSMPQKTSHDRITGSFEYKKVNNV